MSHEQEPRHAPDSGADGVYGDWSSRYGADDPRASGYISPFWFRQERRLILDLVGAHPGRVLDVACGVGLVTKPLADKGLAVFGVDYNGAACRGAVRNGIRAVRGDAFGLPFADGGFDTVTCVEFLQQCPAGNVTSLIGELARITAPAGRVILVWRNHDAPLHRLALRAFNALGRPGVPLNEHRYDDMLAKAHHAGLDVERGGSIFPPLRRFYANRGGAMAGLLGTSLLAVLRKRLEVDLDRPQVAATDKSEE